MKCFVAGGDDAGVGDHENAPGSQVTGQLAHAIRGIGAEDQSSARLMVETREGWHVGLHVEKQTAGRGNLFKRN